MVGFNLTELVSLEKNERKLDRAINEYLEQEKEDLIRQNYLELKERLISECNYLERSKLKSCIKYGMVISAGDICFIDFGRQYLSETGFLHFGLVLKMFNSKALVIPMTSNSEAYYSAYDEKNNPDGSSHLMRLGLVKGLNRYSVLFLNDVKYINTARIIDIKAHIDTDSPLFRKIYRRFLQTVQFEEIVL
ncbi:MAG TPA: hypothetical protein PLI19_02800 [Erysipelotrichaceae bacterium]|nr:hypothetical protein [Erysipelotrichaceae bacterium]HQB32240.1 hypothetical protein [Erysipelotrichaceae bacterium]